MVNDPRFIQDCHSAGLFNPDEIIYNIWLQGLTRGHLSVVKTVEDPLKDFNLDLEKQIKLCAKSINADIVVGIGPLEQKFSIVGMPVDLPYYPVDNDSQCMELIKYHMLKIDAFAGEAKLGVYPKELNCQSFNDDNLNLAVIECVAKKQWLKDKGLIKELSEEEINNQMQLMLHT